MVELDTQAPDSGCELANGGKEAVASPVGVGDVAAERSPPGLTAVDPRGDGGRRVGRDDHAVLAAEVAVEKARVVVDAVVRGEQRRVNAVVPLHDMQHVVSGSHHSSLR